MIPSAADSPAGRAGPGLLSHLALFAVLTILVWGLFAFDRGLWQDDALLLGEAVEALEGSGSLLSASTMPTRLLGRWIFVAAVASGRPIFFLQLLYGACWLACGLLVTALGRVWFRGDPTVGLIAGCLASTATSDYLSNSLVAVGYLVSLTVFLTALLSAWQYATGGRRGALWSAAILLAASLWTSDIALVPTLAAPALFVVAGVGWTRQSRRLLVTWLAVGLPYLTTLIVALRSSRYGRNVVLSLSIPERLERGLVHFVYNFAPWRWAFDRPEWFPEPAAILPTWLYVAVAGSTTAAVAWALLRERGNGDRQTPSGRRPRAAALVALLALCALGTNTAYASVRVSDVFYRTHLGSRVWASLALAAALGGMRRAPFVRGPAAQRWVRVAVASTVACFGGLGAWAGVERQDFYLASWRQHRRELRSLLRAAPALEPATNIVLWHPPHSRYLATEAEYLGLAWIRILHGGWLAERLRLHSPNRKTVCVAEGAGLRCPSQRCPDYGDCRPLMSWESLVILRYDADAGRYWLAETLPDEVLAQQPQAAALYRPERLVVDAAPRTTLVNRLLNERPLLARFVPERTPAEAEDRRPPSAARVEFDRAVNGTGWESPAPGRSASWMTSPVATLHVEVAARGDFCLTAAIEHYLAPDVLTGLSVSANGAPIEVVNRGFDGSRTMLAATLPAAVLRRQPDAIDLVFTLPRLVSPRSLGRGEDARELGLLFDWIALAPCPAGSHLDAIDRPRG